LLENALNDALMEMRKFDENCLLCLGCGLAACAASKNQSGMTIHRNIIPL